MNRNLHHTSPTLWWVLARWRNATPYLLAITTFIVLLDLTIADKTSGLSLRQVGRSFFQAFVLNNFFGFFIGIAFAFCERYSAPRSIFRWLMLVCSIAAAMVLGLVSGTLLLAGLGWFPFAEFFAVIRGSLFGTVSVGLIIGVSIYLYESLKERLATTTLELRTRQLAEERMRQQALAARLEALESRVRPHFLFNTLNSISALTREDPARAERMVELLSALLRYSLDAAPRRTVPLHAELKIVGDYLEIERVRFGERLRCEISVATEFEQVPIPPFALQTLVENSLKHGIAPRRAGGVVQVRAHGEGEVVRLEVWDDGPGFTPDVIIARHGLDNLQTRLHTLFGDQTALAVRRAGPFTVVSITLPRAGLIQAEQ
ncbi:MAG: histidine kinase [Acidobacteria bacterium]|nr:histidine kinase [Acidobacteriota bacterium]